MIDTVKKKWAQYSGYAEFLPLILIGIMLATDDQFDEKLLSSGIKILFIFSIIVILYVCCSVMGFNRKITFVVMAVLWVSLILVKRRILPTASVVN
jgi:hypothetical protein